MVLTCVVFHIDLILQRRWAQQLLAASDCLVHLLLCLAMTIVYRMRSRLVGTCLARVTKMCVLAFGAQWTIYDIQNKCNYLKCIVGVLLSCTCAHFDRIVHDKKYETDFFEMKHGQVTFLHAVWSLAYQFPLWPIIHAVEFAKNKWSNVWTTHEFNNGSYMKQMHWLFPTCLFWGVSGFDMCVGVSYKIDLAMTIGSAIACFIWPLLARVNKLFDLFFVAKQTSCDIHRKYNY